MIGGTLNKTMGKFDQFMEYLEEKSSISSPIFGDSGRKPPIRAHKPNREGQRYRDNQVGMPGKYFKRLDREGSMLSDRDKKAGTPKERLKQKIRQLGKGRRMVINRRQERLVSDAGKRTLRPTGRKRINSKTGATIDHRGSRTVVRGG